MNKFTSLFIFCSLFVTSETLALGGGENNSGGKNNPQNDNCEPGDNGKWARADCEKICKHQKNVSLYLYQIFETPKGRASGGKSVCPAAPIHPWGGHTSAKSLKENAVGGLLLFGYCNLWHLPKLL